MAYLVVAHLVVERRAGGIRYILVAMVMLSGVELLRLFDLVE